MGVSIVIPAYNEEKAISSVLSQTRALKLEKEIIVVDDGSTDLTWEIARKARGVRVLRHRGNRGKANALRTGIDEASFENIVTLDADCTYPASLIPRMLKELERNDLVIGSRFMGKNRDMPVLNSLGNRMFSLMITILTRRRVADSSSGMRAFRKGLWNSLGMRSRNLEGEVEMTTRCLRRGLRVSEVPITYRERVGKSKLSPVRDGFRFLVAIIRTGLL